MLQRNSGVYSLRIILLGKVLLTLLVLSGMYYLARVGASEFLVLKPRAYLEDIQNRKVRLDPAELALARERLILARSWDGSNPVAHEFLGHVAYMRSSLFVSDPPVQSMLLKEAIQHFDNAIAIRPNSAILWADRMSIGSRYIEVSTQLGTGEAVAKVEIPQIAMALRKSAFLGPWEPSVLNIQVQVGRLRYNQFSTDEKVMVDDAAARARQLNLKV